MQETFLVGGLAALTLAAAGVAFAQQAPANGMRADADGDRAYASEVDGQTLLVFGSAPEADLLTLAARLTTEPVGRS